MKFSDEYSKLSNKVFTTIRQNTGFYKTGRVYQIQTLKAKFYAKIIKSELINKLEINDSLAQSDADMTAIELIALLERWYGKTFDDFVLLTLEKQGSN